jgi:E3 ubiquitin-protein ligase Topors
MPETLVRPLRERIELLPSPPKRSTVLDDQPAVADVEDTRDDPQGAENPAPNISIRGAAAVPIKLTLQERLAKARADLAAKSSQLPLADHDASAQPKAPALTHSISDPAQTTISTPGVRAAVQARLKLRLKLASEKKTFVYNQNESRAQILRAQILVAKAAREAHETDAVLRVMDRVDRAKEVRRRLMVLKMMAAETDSERRARELKERLVASQRAKKLREELLKRKPMKGATEGTSVTVA